MTHPKTMPEWYDLWWRRIFRQWLPSPPNNLCIIIFCGGECGGNILQRLLEHQAPTLYFHNIREFHEKYSKFYPPLHFRKRKMLEMIQSHDIFIWLSTKFQRIVVIDIYRCPIQRALFGLYRYPQSSLSKSQISLDTWISASFSQKCSLFERCIFPNIERRHGLDTEYSTHSTLLHRLSIHSTVIEHVPSFPLNVEFIKLRYKDRNHWFDILHSILPTVVLSTHETTLQQILHHHELHELTVCAVTKNTNNTMIHDNLRQFIIDYSPQLPFLQQVLNLPICQRYLSQDERSKLILYAVHEKLQKNNIAFQSMC